MILVPTLSSHLFALSALDEEILSAVADAGFRSIELFAAPQHLPLHDLRSTERVVRAVDEKGMKIAAFHAPFYMSLEELIAGKTYALGDRDPDRRARALASTKDLLSLAAAFGSADLVVHMGHHDAATADAGLFVDSLNRLLGEVKSFTGQLLLENTPHVAESFEELEAVCDASPAGRLGFCIDLGHLHIHCAPDRACGMAKDDAAQRALFDRILGRTRHFHVHDNGGVKDEHLPPGEGTIDWGAVLKRLDAAAGEATFSLELRDLSRGRLRPREYLASVLDRISGPVRDRFKDGGIRL